MARLSVIPITLGTVALVTCFPRLTSIVKGKTEEEAKELIENVNLVVSVDYVYSSTVEAGKVVKYSPSGTVTEGTTVTIEVSRGKQVTKATVPNVIGMTESLANQSIEAAGLKVSVKYETSSKASYGTVTSQTPYSGGDTVESGTTITIYVSHYYCRYYCYCRYCCYCCYYYCCLNLML